MLALINGIMLNDIRLSNQSLRPARVCIRHYVKLGYRPPTLIICMLIICMLIICLLIISIHIIGLDIVSIDILSMLTFRQDFCP